MTAEPTEEIVDLIQGAAFAQVAYVAAELRIADHLANAPMTVSELARATDCHAQSLHRLLRALVTLGFCIEQDDGSIALGRSASLLRSDTVDSLRSWAIWFGRNQWAAWGQLLPTVRTGESARKRMTGADGFGLLEGDPATASTFNMAMVQLTRLVAIDVARSYDFAGARTVVDVGGGEGALLEVLLKANPRLRGVLLDRPHALDGARALLGKAGVAHRCEVVSGDFFESIPAGADVYLLKNIIHDWNDERASLILRNCREALPRGGRLLLIERVLPTRLSVSPSHRAAVHADLTMMLGPGGKERNEREFRQLLRHSGFELMDIKSIALGCSILEAAKAPPG